MGDAWTGASSSDRTALGAALDGLVRVELDSAGLVRTVQVSPDAMRRPPAELGEALAAAFRQAQEAVRACAAGPAGALPTTARLHTLLDEAEAVAERRFDTVATALYDLSRRAEREW